MLSMEEITNIPIETPFEMNLKQEELEKREAELMEKLQTLPKQELALKPFIPTVLTGKHQP